MDIQAIRAGLSSGLKSLAKGVVAGVAGLIAAPVVGATRKGAVNFNSALALALERALNFKNASRQNKNKNRHRSN